MSKHRSTFGSEVSRIFRAAVSSTQNQNRRKGLPNVFMQDGRMCMELPNRDVIQVSSRSLTRALESSSDYIRADTARRKTNGNSVGNKRTG